MDRGDAPRNNADGKGKARDASGEHESGEIGGRHGANGKVLSRVSQSAANLTKNVLSGPPSGAFLARLTGQDKGEASSSSRAQTALTRDGGTSTLPRLRPDTPFDRTMRSMHAHKHVASQEAAFSDFLDKTAASMAVEAGGQPFRTQEAERHARQGRQDVSVEEQEGSDGQDVVALLVTNEGEKFELLENDEPLAADRARLREALFRCDKRGANLSGPQWDNMLNFVPDHLRHCPGPLSQEPSTHLGTADPDEAWKLWVDQWSGVLTRYQDEVWGDLGPLVDEARRDVEKLERRTPHISPPEEPKALLRLRGILGHLRVRL